jgi:hypothetical protein
MVQMEGQPLSPSGDKYVFDNHLVLIHIKPDATTAELCYLASFPGTSVNPNIIKLFYTVLQITAFLWHSAQEPAAALS